jgi:hypothetical protein
MCSDGKSQPDTFPEKDFFFLRGGCGDCRTRGSGGGGGRAVVCSGRDGGREETKEEDGEGVVNAAEASVNGVKRAGMCTGVFVGAVLGRWSAWGRVTRAANDGATGGTGTTGRAGGGGMGSEPVSTIKWSIGENTCLELLNIPMLICLVLDLLAGCLRNRCSSSPQ